MECFTVSVVALFCFVAYVVLQSKKAAEGLSTSPEGVPADFCVRCGGSLSSRRSCPRCGLDPTSGAAIELRELEITTRHIQNFLQCGVVDRDIAERIYQHIEARQTQLLSEDGRGAVPLSVLAEAKPLPLTDAAAAPKTMTADQVSVRLNLNRLLLSWTDVRQVLFLQRRQALAWYEELGETGLDALSPEALPVLARLQEMHGYADAALATVRRLLARQPVGFAFAALDAARWATELKRSEEACWFMEQALERSGSSPRVRDACKELCRVLAADAVMPSRDAGPLPTEEVIDSRLAAGPEVLEVAPVPAPAAAPPPRRTLREMLAAFMEERNILWGELTGGLLIVGCSVALVISLWRTLQEIPYFPFFIISGLTVLLFGAGFYTLRRWNLESTSRGLLAIGTLLVPLNFLVLAGLARAHAGGAAEVVTQIVALVVFALLVRGAGQVLLQPALAPLPAASWLAGAVLGPSACELVMARLLDATPPPTGWFVTLACLVAVCQNLAVGGVLRGLTRLDTLETRQAHAWFAFLGMATFAASMALGFFLHWSDDIRMATQRLSLPMAMACVPVLAGGALVQRVRSTTETETPTSSLPAAASIGNALMLLAIGVLVTTVVMAWPRPEMLIIVCSLGVAATTGVALVYRQPLACAPLPACLVIAYLTALHLHAGNLAVPEAELGFRILHLMLTPDSGSALVVLVVLMNVIAEWLARSERPGLAVCHVAFSGIILLFSLWLVLQVGAEAGRTAIVCGIYGVGGLAINLRWRQPLLSSAAALVLLGFWIYAFFWAIPEVLGYRAVLLGLLANATTLLAISVLAARSLVATDIVDVLVRPLRRAAFAFSLPAIALIVHEVDWDWLLPLAGVTAWLGGLWLTLAALDRRCSLLAAAQTALSVAMLFLVANVLARQPWVNQVEDLVDPRSLLAFGTGLAALCLIWEAARRAAGSGSVLVNAGLTADRLQLGVLVVGFLAFSIWGIYPDVLRELSLSSASAAQLAWHRHASHPMAWLMLVTLVAAVAVAAERQSRPIALVVLALAALAQMAARFYSASAVVSALCWGLSGAFLVYAIAAWLRNIGRGGDTKVTAIVRRMILGGAVAPVLALTVRTAWLGFAGDDLPGGLFPSMATLPALAAPLLLIALGLVALGLTLRSPRYLFAAGLVVQAALSGGYALGVALEQGAISQQNWARLLQLSSCVAALWGLTCNPSSRWTGWHSSSCRRWQTWLAAIGIGTVLLESVVLYITMLPVPEAPPEISSYPTTPRWIVEAGSSLGWTALILAGVAAFWDRWRQWHRISTHEATLFALGVVVLMASSLESRLPAGWGYRVLMFGVFGYTLAGAVFLPALVRRRVPQLDSVGLQGGDELILVALLGGLGTILAACAAGQFQDRLGAALAVALGGLAVAALAAHCRRQDYAFLAGFNLNQAVALLAAYVYRADYLFVWLVPFVQANIIAAAALTLVWLRWRRQLPAIESTGGNPAGGSVRDGDQFLTVQVVLLSLANIFLLTILFHRLLLFPAGPLSGVMHYLARSLDPTLTAREYADLLAHALMQMGDFGGWMALLLSLPAVVWYARQLAPRWIIHVIGGGGLLVGTLAACTATQWGPGTWLPHHVLTFAWSTLGLLILAAGWMGSSLRQLGPLFWPAERRMHAAHLLGIFFPRQAVQRWAEIIGVLVVALAVRGVWSDSVRPYASVAATLAVSMLMAALAVWSRQPIYVHVSGALVNLAGFIIWQAWLVDSVGIAVWMAWGPDVFDTLLFGQVLSLAAAAGAWSIIGMRLRHAHGWEGWASFPPLASTLALYVLALVIVAAAASDLTGMRIHLGARWAWPALLASAAALTLQLWDRSAPSRGLTYTQLRVTGLLGVGLGLHLAELPPVRWLWSAGWLLALFVGSTMLLDWIARNAEIWRRLRWRIPSASDRRAGLVLQAVLIGVVAMLSGWMSCSFAMWTERATGPAALMLILPAVWTVASSLRQPEWGRRLVLLLAGAVLIEAGWTALLPSRTAAWLDRTALLLAVSALLSVLYSGRLIAPFRHDSPWSGTARRLGLPLGAWSCVVLAALLVQELCWYEPGRGTPMPLSIVLASAISLVLLIIGTGATALTAIEEHSFQRRTHFVYAAESLLLLTLLHLRLNVPHWFPFFLGRHWTVVVMAVALAGYLLGEFSRRRRADVLADPLQRTSLLLPLLPLLAYQARPLAALLQQSATAMPGLDLLGRMLERLPAHYAMHALHWFVLGLLYLLAAWLRRSHLLALLAGLAGNGGWWVVLANEPTWAFARHPQLWLVPPAVLILAAEQCYRHALGARLAAGIRHLGLALLFLSSTADMFITGLGNSVVLPIVLAVFSVSAVLAGILLRVRAFLACGLLFLFVDVFAQIWHAAVHRQQTWVWWASGIVLGAAILALFALFEKRRNDLLRMFEEVQQWS